MNAYDDLGDLYDTWVTSVVDDVPFYTGLARELGAGTRELTVVEPGCGSGRVTLPLARAGCRVAGIDSSAVQLRRLAEAACDASLDSRVQLIAGDMTDVARLVPHESADLVVAAFRTLNHLAPDDSVQTMRALASVLKPGGTLAFDVFHLPDDGVLHEEWTPRVSVGDVVIDERAHILAPGQVQLDIRCRRGDGKPVVTSMQLFAPSITEWTALLQSAGLRVTSATADFARTPLHTGAHDSVWVAMRENHA